MQEGSTWARKAILEARRARPADKVALFTVVEAGCSVSTPPEVRTDLAAMFKKHAEHLAGGSITFEGKGFQMTMVRSIVTAINMASRTQFPNAVFGDIAAAAAWLSARAPSLHVPEILSAVDQLRK